MFILLLFFVCTVQASQDLALLAQQLSALQAVSIDPKKQEREAIRKRLMHLKELSDGEKKDLESIPGLNILDEEFGVWVVRKSGYIFLYSDLMQGIRSDDSKPLASRLNHAVQDYKIHLMPFLHDIPKIIIMLFDELKRDVSLRSSITTIKFIRNGMREEIYNDQRFPIMVIYPASGKAHAQKVLDTVYKLFKDLPGMDITPRFNEKITSLIYVAQGDGDDKKLPENAHYFESGLVYFKADVTGKVEDYHLVNPAQQKIAIQTNF